MTGRPGPLSIERTAALLAAGPDLIVLESRALGREACRWRPAHDTWCLNEVVGHLIEADRRAFSGRIRAILAADTPVLEAWDQAAVAAGRRDVDRDAVALTAELRALRLDGVAMVRSLAPDDLARAGDHPKVGLLRVDEILAEWVHHDREHIHQALGIAEAWSWAHMGGTRRFSDPDA